MDFLISAAKSLNSTSFNIIIGIGVFILFLILMIIKGSIFQSGIKILTKRKPNFCYMIIPSCLSVITNMLLLVLAYIFLIEKGINVLDTIVAYMFDSLTDFTPLLYIIITLVVCEVIFIIIQAFILKLITFDIYASIKKLVYKITKKQDKYEKNEYEDTLTLVPVNDDSVSNMAPRPLSFANGLLTGFFCFSIMFFLTIILIYIGESIGPMLLEKITNK